MFQHPNLSEYLQPGRNWNSDQYRYGFNGQEMDNEITGSVGTHTTAMFWEYDTRLMRRWNLDPVVKQWESPYLCFSGNPIWFSDVNGDDAGHWLTRGGRDVGDDGRADDNTYVVDDETYSGYKNGTTAKDLRNDYEASGGKKNGFYKLGITYTIFKGFVSTVWAESSGNMYESFGIASAIKNASERYNMSLYSITCVSNDYAKGAASKDYSEIIGDDRYSKSAVINAMLGGKDYSNGATHWDGRDLLTFGVSHYRFSQSFTKDRVGIYIPNEQILKAKLYYVSVVSYYWNSNNAEKQEIAKSIVMNNPFNQSFSTYFEDARPALWEVTSASGQTIFFKELPANSGKSRSMLFPFTP